MEGTHTFLMDSFLTRKNAVDKCALVTKSRGWKVFAIQDGGWCASSSIAHLTYNKYSTADNCVGGKGGMFANDVYIIDGKCFKVHNEILFENRTLADWLVEICRVH